MDRVIRCDCGQRMRIPEGVQAGRGTCVRCGAVVRIPEERTRKRAAISPSAFESDSGQPESPQAQSARPASALEQATPPERRSEADAFEEIADTKSLAPPARQADHCARCGRTFRGAWDRHVNERGPICSICTRQASELVPPAHLAHLPAGTVAPPTREELREIRQAAEAAAEPPPETRDYRGLVPFLIVSGLVMLAVLVLPVEEWMARLVMSARDGEVRDVSPEWSRVLWLLVFAFLFLRELGAVYLGLHQAGQTSGWWLSDIADAAKYAAMLCAPSYIFMFVLPVPPLLAIPMGLLVPLFLWAFTSLDGMTVLYIFIFRSIMEPFMWGLKWLVVGSLGLLLT